MHGHSPTCRRIAWIASFALCLACATAPAADWPHWRGPNHDGSTPERLVPEGRAPTGLRKVWQANVAEGCGAVVAAQGRMYATGWRDGQEIATCLDAKSGEVLWTQRAPCPRYGRHAVGDQNWYTGPTATPTLDVKDNLLFTLSQDGDLRCRDVSRQGAQLWHVNLYDRYGIGRRPNVGGGQRDFGMTTAPLIDGNTLYVAAGGAAGLLRALDKHSGEDRWAAASKAFSSNCGGLTPLRVSSGKAIAVLALDQLVVVRTEPGHTGETLASVPWATEYANNLVTPTIVGKDGILLSSAYNQSRSVLFELTPAGLVERWNVKIHSGVGSPALRGANLFLPYKKLTRMRASDGGVLWQGGSFGPDGSCLVTGDGFVLAYGSGKLVAARADADIYQELARLDGLGRPNECWPHVVLSDGLIFCREKRGTLTAVNVAP